MDHQDIAVADELQTEPLLRALEAGWTTLEDRAFAVPILHWVHLVLVAEPVGKALHSEGENSSYYDAALQGTDQEDKLKGFVKALVQLVDLPFKRARHDPLSQSFDAVHLGFHQAASVIATPAFP